MRRLIASVSPPSRRRSSSMDEADTIMAGACRERRPRVRSKAGTRRRSGAVDQHQFGIVERGEAQEALVANGGAVAFVDADVVDGQGAARRHEIGVAAGLQRI